MKLFLKATRKERVNRSNSQWVSEGSSVIKVYFAKPAFYFSHSSSKVISQQFSRSRSVCLLLLCGKSLLRKTLLGNFSGKILLEGSSGGSLKHYFEPAIRFCQAVGLDFARRLIFHSHTVMHASLHIFTCPRNHILLNSIFHKC